MDDLPEDFYSSKYYIDKAIEFIESNRQDGLPFFSYIAFQAVHTPVQAPQKYIDKYMGKYDAGWQKLRESRLENAKAKKIVPPGTTMVKMGTSVEWDSLSDAEKQYESKKMAVYAGMVDAMDHHIGRLVTYFKETGQYDNTVFIFTSDNGPACTDVDSNPVAWERLYLKLWMKANGYNRDYETLGTRGSYINMGMTFASSAASPLAYFKFWVGEGGMRVPLIISGKGISGKGISEKGKMSNAFTYVTDITPTILDIAGVKPHQGSYQGRRVEPMIGKSLLPLVKGTTDRVYHEDETIGYELTGHAALFKGDYKIVRNRAPVGDDAWHLFNIVEDPGETRDLKEKMPERFKEMMADYRTYVSDNNVLPVPEGYEYFNALRSYATRSQLKAHWPAYAAVGVVIIGLIGFFITRRFKQT
jgi:arylsulfatase/uncharacterized sulfatase